MVINVSWSEIKAFAVARNLSIQWVQTNNVYYLAAIDGPVEITAVIPFASPTPDGSNQYDFETNFQAAGNKSPKAKVVQELGSDSYSIYPQGALFAAPAGATTVYDLKLSTTLVARGGIIQSFNMTPGDWITVDVIDKDNVVGAGGTSDNPTLLDDYIPQWFMMTGQNEVIDISISAPLPAGLYFRFTYHSVSTAGSPAGDTVVAANILSYVSV